MGEKRERHGKAFTNPNDGRSLFLVENCDLEFNNIISTTENIFTISLPLFRSHTRF